MADMLNSQEYKDARSQLVQQWNQRQYDLCLKSITTCIKLSSSALAVKPNDQMLQKEIRQLIAYRVAVALLKEIIALSSSGAGAAASVVDIALLTKFLADLPLHAQHRLDCIRLAIDKNIAAKNFGIAARLIQVLMPHNLPDAKEQAEKFKVCKSHKWSDHQLPPYVCPACGQKVSPAAPECTVCGTAVKFCCTGYKLLSGPIICKCPLCEATFNKTQQSAGTKCPLCEAATIEELNLEKLWQERQKQVGAASPSELSTQSPVTPVAEKGMHSQQQQQRQQQQQHQAQHAVTGAVAGTNSELHLQGATDDGDVEQDDAQ